MAGDYCRLDIGNDCYVLANKFRGKILIHVRLYDTSESGTVFPTNECVTLGPQQWKKLQVWHCKDVDETIEIYLRGEDVDLMIHLGRNNCVSLKTGYAQLTSDAHSC